MSSWSTGPSWGVTGGAKLQSQLDDESTNHFDRTIRPFESRTRSSTQTKPRARQSERPPREPHLSSVKESRPSQRMQQQPRLTQSRLQSQPRQERLRPSQHSAAPRRSLRLSQLSSQPSEQQPRSQRAPDHRMSSLQPLKSISSHRTRLSERISLSDLSSASVDSSVEFSRARRREIMSRVTTSVQEVMESMLPGKPNNAQWKSKLRKKNIEYYVDETSVKPGQTRFCCVSHTHATVDEVMSLFLPMDKDSLLRTNRMMYNNLLESRVLTMLRGPTKERPMNSMYAQYSSFHTPGPLANRETCVAVATDMIRQPDGSTIGYCLWDSFDGAAKTPGFETCRMFRTGFFVRHSRESSADPMQGQTKIVFMVGLESGTWESGLPTRILMERYGSTLNRLCSHLRRKNLDPCTFVTKSQWEPKMRAKSCKQCEKPFQVLSSRVNCHACGHVVCKSCASKESVELLTVGLVSIHVCFWCLEKAGLPAPESAQKTRASLRQKRLDSETASTFRQSIAVVYADMTDDDDDEDTDDGEWAITTLGVPVRPTRMAACV